MEKATGSISGKVNAARFSISGRGEKARRFVKAGEH
jgi:hypothetical protein